MKVRFASPAERELKEAAEFYESAQEGLGADFLAEVEEATQLMESHPLAWTADVTQNPALPGAFLLAGQSCRFALVE